MKLTGNYNLKKPDQTDNYNIENENDNMDIIDKTMGELETKVDNLNLDAANVTFTSSLTAFTSKNVKLALDYLFQLANDGKKYWVDVVGTPLILSDTFATLKAKTQIIKNVIAANITSKGVPVNNTDTLTNLADAISRISVSSLGGYEIVSGTITSYNIEGYSTGANGYACYVQLPQLSQYKEILFFRTSGNVNLSYNGGTIKSKPVSCAYMNSSKFGKFYEETAGVGTTIGDSIARSIGIYYIDNNADSFTFDFNINKIYILRYASGSVTFDSYNINIPWSAIVKR